MTDGTITSLGLGSGLDLQDILESLRGADESILNVRRVEKLNLELRLSEFNVIKSKLQAMKRNALSLSLGSNFLPRSVSVSDTEIFSASVVEGATIASHTINITRMATNNSWDSTGVASETSSVYVPVTRESTTGYDDTDTTAVITEDDSMTITHGYGDDRVLMQIDLTDGMTLDDIVNEINTDTENTDGEGGTVVTASTFLSDGDYYLRITATSGGSGETNRVMITDSPTDITFTVPDTTFEYTLGDSSESISISVSSDTSIADLAALINDDEDNPGVTAAAVDIGTGETPFQLILTADSSGEDNRITIDTQLADLTLTEAQGAGAASLNAEIEIDGITYQRQSNSNISDILQGATFTISATGSVTANVTANYQSNQSAISSMITTMNDIINEIIAHDTYDEDTGEWGTLARAGAIKGLKIDLPDLLGTTINTGGSITSLYDLGFEVDKNGNVSIDSAAMTAAFMSNSDDIITLFIGDSDNNITGLGELLYEELKNLTGASGLMTSEIDVVEDRIDRIDTQVALDSERLDKRYETLTSQFVALDLYMSKMQSQSDYLANMFNSFVKERN